MATILPNASATISASLRLTLRAGTIIVTTGNTMAPCVIIGERAAEILREERKL